MSFRGPLNGSNLKFDEFFEPFVQDQDWHGAAEKATTARFRALRDALKRTLKDMRGNRVGETQIDTSVIGNTGDGEWAGLKTKLVEM